MKYQKCRFLMALGISLALPGVALPADYDLSWFTVDGGGGVSSGGGLELTGSIAQPDAGVMSGSTFDLSGGFIVGIEASPAIPGDCDADGDVDADDYVCFHDCLTGPAGGLLTDCDPFDFDEDDDVDLLDFADFTLQFAGS